MLPDPLHPAVVHFPMALVILVPIAAIGALWAIHRGASFRAAWAVPLVAIILLLASAWVATRTGEAEEERVESTVGEQALHTHEEAAERFLILSGVLLLIAASGLARGKLGHTGRLVTTIAAFGLAIAGMQVGAAGGELVYRHGAASVYVENAASTTQPGAVPARAERDDGD